MVVTTKPASPGVRFPPPLLFVVPFFVSFLLDQRVSFIIDGQGAGAVQMTIGCALLVSGFGLMFWGMIAFARLRTSLLPFRPARTLVIVPP